MLGVRRVIGGHTVDHTVCQRPAQRERIGFLAQRRIHPVASVVAGKPAVIEHEVVRRHLGGDRNPLLLSPFQNLHRARSRGVADVDARTGIAGQQRIACDDRFLCRPWPARESQTGGGRPFVGHSAHRESGFLGMLGDQHAQTGRVLQRSPHHQRVVHAQPVVGEQTHLCQTGSHQPHLGELAALETHRHRTDRMHIAQTDLLAALPDVVGDDRAVGDRIGVGHREHRGVAAESRCCRTGFDILGILPPRFAEMGMQVDQSGQQHLTGRIDHLGVIAGGERRTDLRDLTIGDQHVNLVPLAVKPDTFDQDRAGHRIRHTLTASSVPTIRWNSTAIRTCTPLDTCCSTADCGESATEKEISIPRSMGPGCSTTACAASMAARCSERP